MIYGKLPTTLLFLFSFIILTIGGYQCATKTIPERTNIPIENSHGGTNGNWSPNSGGPRGGASPLYPEGYGSDSSGVNGSENLPPDTGNRCAASKKKYRSLSEKYGKKAGFKFDNSSLEDYRLGAKQNFDLKCARIYLDMSRSSSSSLAYKGMLTISFEDGRSIQVHRYQSGFTANENKYNRWAGTSWRPNSSDRVDKKFYAIFENKEAAVILRLEEVRVEDVRDGR